VLGTGRRPAGELKRHGCFHLNNMNGSISAESGTENAGRFTDGGGDCSERSSQIIVRKVEIRVVEQVEELEGQSELIPFPLRDFCHLFRREVRIPVAGPPEFIAQSTDEVDLGRRRHELGGCHGVSASCACANSSIISGPLNLLASTPPAALETRRRRADALFPDSRLVPTYDGDLLGLREFFRHLLGVDKFMAGFVAGIKPGEE